MGKYKFVGGGQKKGENQKRRRKKQQRQIADSSLWGTLKPKIEEKPNWILRKERQMKC